MKSLNRKKSITWFLFFSLFVAFSVAATSVNAQKEDLSSFEDLEKMEDRNLDYMRQIHEIVQNYPSFSYTYTLEDGEVQDVVVTGVDREIDKKRIEVALFDLKSNKNMMKKKPNRIGVFYSVDKEPKYNGGSEKLEEVLQYNLEYPQEAENWGLEGTIYVQFVVDENGEIPFATTSTNVETAIDPYLEDLEEQAISGVKATSGEWEPGQIEGVKVPSLVVVPITFEFENENPHLAFPVQ